MLFREIDYAKLTAKPEDKSDIASPTDSFLTVIASERGVVRA
jgi:hypothetical protein